MDTRGTSKHFFELYNRAKKIAYEHNTVHMDPQMIIDSIEKRNQNAWKYSNNRFFVDVKEKQPNKNIYLSQIVKKNKEYDVSFLPRELNLEKIAIFGNIDSPLGLLNQKSFDMKLNLDLTEKYSHLVKDPIGVYGIFENDLEFINGKKLYIVGSATNNLKNSEMVGSEIESENSIVGILGNFKNVLARTERKPLIYPIHTNATDVYGILNALSKQKFQKDVV